MDLKRKGKLIEGCLQWENKNKCLLCDFGYFLREFKCFKCFENCELCFNEK
jgi:hypothetical protein